MTRGLTYDYGACPGGTIRRIVPHLEWSNRMNSTHMDALAEWWENAEDAPASPGDRIIERHVCERDEDTYYTVGVHREGMRGLIGKPGTRILTRAPKPKPAWHDAVAVIAQTPGRDDRRAFIRSDNGWWEDADFSYETDELEYVTPLIEAKVTGEMVEAARQEARDRTGAYWERSLVSRMLTAALGLEAE